MTATNEQPEDLRFDEDGLVPAVVQQHDTGEVLMLAWMSAETLAATLSHGETVFWSRSRGEPWHKGATSGNTQRVVSVTADCDRDALLVRVDQRGEGACHTGARSCFHVPVGGPVDASGGGPVEGGPVGASGTSGGGPVEGGRVEASGGGPVEAPADRPVDGP